jgi:hypothetical protein
VDLNQITAIVGALGIGSVLGQWLTNAGSRRKLRADALLALSDVESSRWHSMRSDNTDGEFTVAARKLQAACVVARIPAESSQAVSRIRSGGLVDKQRELGA